MRSEEKRLKKKKKKRTKRESHGICVLKFESNNVIREPKHGSNAMFLNR